MMPNLLGFVDDRRDSPHSRSIWVNGPVIVGAGPSGLATAACLREQGVPFVVLERTDCTASLWRNGTYNRLRLHLPKRFCQLPGLRFPEDYPEYLTRRQFIDYIDSYASHFDIRPNFGEHVQLARYDETGGLWRVKTVRNRDAVETGTFLGRATTSSALEIKYICRWLVVATGENAECVIPDIEGLADFRGEVLHASNYKSGEKFSRKRVLVVGSGNSGMEVTLDLCNHDAYPSIVVRSSVHVLPRDILGRSTFELAMFLTRWLPIRVVDKLLVILAWLVLGNIEKFGIERPTAGPVELKNRKGKTPVLDTGALEKIRSGKIKVVPARIKRFELSNRVEFVNGDRLEFDSVVLATGYRSNVPSWLQENELFNKDGYPKLPFPSGWKGNRGLYAVGFTGRGLSGASSNAIRVAQDIGSVWKQETEQLKKTASAVARHKRCISQLQF